MRIVTVLLLVAVFAKNVENAKILLVNPMPSYSHFIIPFRLAEALTNRGHHVTAISAYPQKTKIKNYVDIPVVEHIELMEEIKRKLFDRSNEGFINTLTGLFDMITTLTNATINHKNVQKLLQSDEHFDIVLIEDFLSNAFVGLGHRFKAPVVLVYANAANPMNNYIFGNPAPTSYVPSAGGTFTKNMNFWERLQNFASTRFFEGILHFKHLPRQKQIFESFIKDASFEDVLYNTSLMLTNSHVSISDAVPHVPSIVEVGGFYITNKPLPADLQKFLDEATEGVVLFSMGSNLESRNLKPETRAAILRAFSKLKEKVLWKFETDLPDAPPNVKISSWLPQADVLKHPNVRAFITHGGRLSTVEAVYFGIPIIGIPVFGDQPNNVAHAVNDGYAIYLDINELTEEKLTAALNEILRNPKYRENVQHRSKLMHDQPIKPLDAAIFWVEHVIRHKGAPHLRSAALDLEWYQRELLDVYVFIAAVFATFMFVVYKVIKKVCGFVCGKVGKKSKSKKIKKQ